MPHRREGLAARREAVGFSQESLAEYVGVDARTIRRWERGEKEPYAKRRQALADALHLTLTELEAILNGHPAPPLGHDNAATHRTTGRARPSERSWLAVPSADPGFANLLLGSIAQYSRTDNLHGPHQLLPLVTEQTRFAMGLIATTTGRHQIEIIQAASRLAEFTGWLLQDAGNLSLAMQWTTRALDLALEVGDHQLVSYLWMRKANIASDARRPALVKECARAGLANSNQISARLRAVILRVEAHGHAITGDYDACARSIDAAHQEVINVSGVTDDLAGYCTTGYIEMEAAHCWTELGRPEAAIDRLTQELDDWNPAFQRDLGLCLARLGVAQARAGDLDAAIASGQRSIGIVTQTRSQRTIDQLQKLTQLIETPATTDDAAQLRSKLLDLEAIELPHLEGPSEWI